MLDDDQPETTDSTAPDASADSAAPSVSESPADPPVAAGDEAEPATKAPARKTAARKTAAKKTTARKAAARTPAKRAAKKTAASADVEPEVADAVPTEEPPAPATRTPRKRAAKKTVAEPVTPDTETAETAEPAEADEDQATTPTATAVLFQAPEPKTPRKRASRKKAVAAPVAPSEDEAVGETPAEEKPADPAAEPATVGADAGDTTGDATGDTGDTGEDTEQGTDDENGARRRSRRRGGRRRRRSGSDGADDDVATGDAETDGTDNADGSATGDDDAGSGTGSRRRRRRRRPGEEGSGGSDDPENTVTRTRKTRNPEDEITALSGSTRLEAKKQRRREGREAGRRRAPIVSEAEFLARRESVDRTMVIRQKDDLTQIAVLEDKVLVEHYVARASQTSLIGNVYLGRVQNVLPSMEAAFIDIGKGRNAVLYAGEVNWKALGAKDGQPRKVESVLSSGQPILVQVTKDPLGHKGARLTGQITLAGRFLVYVPDGTTSGISRKLPDTERTRLKTLLREVVPDTASVIVRTAAEGASEDELTADVERLKARWSDIEAKIAGGQAPQLLYGEPDLTLKVVRDLFTEDFTKLVIQGDDAWDLVEGYVTHVAPDLRERLERWRPDEHDGVDLFGSYRLDEQIAKGLDRKVWLPSGGSLIIDRTEAMTVVDVNTGKFTGSGGNLEETVTKNNLEAAEEIVRQLRLRDIGGIIVIDFIDMVLESNRDLVLRRLVECLGRDRTRHQVAEVTSLGLVQMTRKRLGTGLLEAFSEECEHCKGRGLVVHEQPIEPTAKVEDAERRGGRRGRGGRGGNGGNGNGGNGGNGHGVVHHSPSPATLAAMPRHEHPPTDDAIEETTVGAQDEPVVDEVHVATDAPATDAPGAEDVVEEAVADADAHVEVVEESVLDTAPDPVTEPPADPAPRLVTTSRRRSARRAAGPPAAIDPERAAAAAPSDGARSDDEVGEAGDAEAEETVGSLWHVPIKRKGSRRK